MKVIHVFAVNTLLTAIVIGNAFSENKQFYPSIVYITRSKPSVAIIGIEVIICLILYIEFITKLFFGEIFASERESLRDNIWPTFLDSCFAFAIFAKNGDYLFYFRLICLLGFKTIHFMAELRVRSMGTVLRLPNLFHLRFIGLLLYLGITDVYQITASALSLTKSGPSFEILYLFEYSLLFLSLLNILGEYILECIEKWKGENGWEEKVVYSNYLELVLISLKSILQLVMTRVLIKIKIFPIFMIRNLVINIKKVKECFDKVVNSLRAISRMDRFPNPRPEDLSEESMCSICRDEIKSIESAKKLFCKHVFHITCLKAWFRRQQRCPTCRSDVVNAPTPAARNPAQNNDRQPEEVENENQD